MFLSSFFGYALGGFLYVGALPHPVSFLRQKPGDFLGGEIFRVFVGAMKIARNLAVFER